MVTLEVSDREALLLSAVLDDAILNTDVEIDILEMHFPGGEAEIAELNNDLDSIYVIASTVDNAIWMAEVGA